MRNVLVTGGTRGLGLAITKVLARQGDRVIALGRNRNADFDAAVGSATAGPGAIEFEAFDLGNIDGIAAMTASLRKKFGKIGALVNNAGIGTHGVLATMPNAEIERLMRVNSVAPIVLTKYVVRHMMADGSGAVVNVASIVAFTGFRSMSAYAASKASLVGFTKSLAREVGSFGITVNAVAPGFLSTEMTTSLGEGDQQQIARRSALRRLATVDDVAQTVAFLLGDGARNITGTVVTVDAGNTA